MTLYNCTCYIAWLFSWVLLAITTPLSYLKHCQYAVVVGAVDSLMMNTKLICHKNIYCTLCHSVNYLSGNTVLDFCKFKAFADYKLNVG